MKAKGASQHDPKGKRIALTVLAAAAAMGLYIAARVGSHPSTDDASIDAEVVHVAAAVGGRVIEIAVEENAAVEKGAMLFRIDPEPYALAVAQAQADLAVAEGALATRRRAIATEKANAAIAADQTKRAETNRELALRTQERLRPLAGKAYVPAQQFDQAQTAARDATTSLQQAREQEAAAQAAVGADEGAVAAVEARRAALAIAKRALEDTVVRAPHKGRVAGLAIRSGEMVVPAQALFTLIVTDEWLAVGNFRETEVSAIDVGDCATVYSMIDRRVPIRGVVTGIGWGVLDTDRINVPHALPMVQRSLNWVRVAQRFPVRVALEHPPEKLMRLGASAVIEVKHGDACR